MRKFFSILLSLYIVVLTLVPCVDHDLGTNSYSNGNVVAGQVSQHQEDQDCCSPFCNCACCGLSIEVAKIFVMEQQISLLQSVSCTANPRVKSGYSFSIWQPPKSC
jgi:hypothetical protein